MTLPAGTVFLLAPWPKKYTAFLPWNQRVDFGDARYQHYRDSVPANRGGGIWSRSDHLDPVRRAAYRRRHAGLKLGDGRIAKDVPFTPAWFSWHYLW